MYPCATGSTKVNPPEARYFEYEPASLGMLGSWMSETMQLTAAQRAFP